MIWLLAALACKDETADSGSGTECGRLVDYPGTTFAAEPVEWVEGQSLYDVGEPSDQVHNSLNLWTTYLDVHGRADPIADANWDGKDVLLWLNRYNACEPRSYTWADPFVSGTTRTVPGQYSQEGDCDLQWTEAWVFLIDEVDGAADGDVCADSGP